MNTHSLKPRFHEHNGCVLLIRHMKKLKKKKREIKRKQVTFVARVDSSEFLNIYTKEFRDIIFSSIPYLLFFFPQTM